MGETFYLKSAKPLALTKLPQSLFDTMNMVHLETSNYCFKLIVNLNCLGMVRRD